MPKLYQKNHLRKFDMCKPYEKIRFESACFQDCSLFLRVAPLRNNKSGERVPCQRSGISECPEASMRVWCTMSLSSQ